MVSKRVCVPMPLPLRYGLNPVDAAKLASVEALRPTVSAGLMPPELSRVVRSMWDPHDQKRPTFLKIIEKLRR